MNKGRKSASHKGQQSLHRGCAWFDRLSLREVELR
jgi:hypothetical protein